ncbi:hypothetical protein [Acinetobacter rudis]|uniref:Uncharacterized protein n=1 Tax=Acinetobacter rudis TaxID=632955 RepID=A0AAW8J8N0_9GAMM|nr:hypothetical protein [Acinetobacter rudis]MDQ8935848.1 hypothetical protein [Acinetobacter rudis]MDQ8954337.1 hypothetical protein [Acinetobacter rudis]MDQ9018114.1 hypothetical protein [Acinetobacter rudis]
MDVIAYVHNADLLVEDGDFVAVIAGSHYVLSVGDRVYIDQVIDELAQIYQVKISFHGAEHIMLHEDEMQVKFQGKRELLQQYLNHSHYIGVE